MVRILIVYNSRKNILISLYAATSNRVKMCKALTYLSYLVNGQQENSHYCANYSAQKKNY